MKKKDTVFISDTAYSSIDDDLDGKTIADAVTHLDSIHLNLLSEGWKNLRFKLESSYDWSDLNIIGDRPETEDEKKKRLSRERSRKLANQKKEEMEYQKYLKLKEKFGDK